MSGSSTVLLLSLAGACSGAVAGSFLNVVIHRLPRLINAEDGRVSMLGTMSALAWPPSHCPGCQHQLAWRDNVPILSYFVLRGRCRFCHQAYGLRYLAVEIMAAIAFAYCAVTLGLTGQAFLGALFLAGLIALSIIDIEEQLLPDALLAPLFCLGLVFHSLYSGGIADALLGSAAGYGVLWLIRESYRLYAGAEGMGYGDVKFASVIGVWLGAAAIPAVLAIAFAAGVAVMLPFSLFGRIGARVAVPFGPFLALGGICAFVLPNLAALVTIAFLHR